MPTLQVVSSRLTLTALLVLAAVARAEDPQPAGPEFQVNTFTPGSQGVYLQRSHDVCTHADGSFVVVWESAYLQDGDGHGVFGQRYDSAGAALGSEFQVNSYVTGYQESPDLACLDDAGFVVVWTGFSATGYRISGKRFDANGVPQTGDLALSGSAYELPSVAAAPGAGFVVVWTSDTPHYAVQARRFASDGTPLGSEVTANGDTQSRVRAPQIDTDAAGNFVVVWENQDGDGLGAAVRRFDSTGAPLGTDFQASLFTTADQERPSVSLAGDGSFVVVWHSNQGDYGVSAQRFDSSGNRLGAHFQVNVAPSEAGYYGAFVDHDAAGNFVVTWTSYEPNYGNYGVFGRRFDSAGTPLGTEFQANTYTPSMQMYGRVSATPAGDFVVAWVSRYQDGARYGIFARRWVAPEACGTLVAKRTTLGFEDAGADSVGGRADFETTEAFDPSSTDTLELAVTDGAGGPIFSTTLQPGALWSKSKPEKRRFTWKDPTAASGLAALKITERPFGSGRYRMTFRGKHATLLQGTPTAGTHQLRVELSSGPCFAGGTASCRKRPTRETCSAS